MSDKQPNGEPLTFQGGARQDGQPAPATQPGASGTASQGQGQQPQQAPEQPTAPQYVTLDEAKRLADEAAQRAFRDAQSYFDKGNQKVRQRLDQLEDSWKIQEAAGITIPDADKARARQYAIQQAMTEPPITEQPQAAQPQQPQGGNIDPITADAWRMMQEAGIQIENSDPEAEMVKVKGSPWEYLQSVREAIDAKRQRTASPTNPQPNGDPGPGRLPTALGGAGSYNPNPIADVTDPRELLRMAREKGEL